MRRRTLIPLILLLGTPAAWAALQAAHAPSLAIPGVSHPLAPCPVAESLCQSTLAEATVPHDFPNAETTHYLMKGCLRGTRKKQVNPAVAGPYCRCLVSTISATPGEWRAGVVGAFRGGPMPPLVARQIHTQAAACVRRALFSGPFGAPDRSEELPLAGSPTANHPASATTPSEQQGPIPFAGPEYEQVANNIVAHHIREVRVAEERQAMGKAGGHPVVLPTGLCSATVTVLGDGIISGIHMGRCASAGLEKAVRQAIEQASPLPPPGVTMNLVINLRVPAATPGVDGD